MDNTWRFNNDVGQKKGEEVSKYHTWGGWDILTPKTQEWSSSLVIHNPSGQEQPDAAYKTLATDLPIGLNMSDLEADAKEFHPRSHRANTPPPPQQHAPAAELVHTHNRNHTHAQNAPPPVLPKFAERNDDGFKFIVKTFAVDCSRHLLLYSIPPSLTAEDLYNIMSAYGDIESMDCSRKDDIGVILLSYFDLRDAATALKRLSAPSMPVEAQCCISRVDQSSEQLYDEHKLLVKPKMKGDRGFSLNDVIASLGEHGEISNFFNSGERDKVVEFPDSRALKLAVSSSSFSGKFSLSRIPLPAKTYRLGLSLDKFLRCHNQNKAPAPAPKHGAYYDKGGPRGVVGPDTIGSQMQFPGVYQRHQGKVLGHMPRQGQPGQGQTHSPRSDGGRRAVLGGSHPHHQSLARGVSKKKQPATEFVINLESVRSGLDRRTSLMVRNIPNKYDLKMVLEEIDVNFKREYDFFYLPIDFKNRCNVGYAFINFIDPKEIEAFCSTFDNRKWNRFNSEKVCKISYARIQGKERLVTRFQNSSLMEKDESCRPVIFHSDGPMKGLPASFPAIPHS